VLVVAADQWKTFRTFFAVVVTIAWLALVIVYLAGRRDVSGPVVLSIIGLMGAVGAALFTKGRNGG
jgi:hypothetical protein